MPSSFPVKTLTIYRRGAIRALAHRHPWLQHGNFASTLSLGLVRPRPDTNFGINLSVNGEILINVRAFGQSVVYRSGQFGFAISTSSVRVRQKARRGSDVFVIVVLGSARIRRSMTIRNSVESDHRFAPIDNPSIANLVPFPWTRRPASQVPHVNDCWMWVNSPTGKHAWSLHGPATTGRAGECDLKHGQNR